ncbi:MAG: acyl-CoA carboxylase subunit beta, partial [Candidatus Sericytochromatia bacterium]|nr:acyl-CoA carboxylase subunit beta [Candidatus Tanganyikabacteria bacterium]
MGGPEAVAKQHAAGKLTARERVAVLVDKGTFEETGIQATAQPHPDLAGKDTPADGVITGFGKVGGRLVAIAAYDFTVIAGTIGMVSERKVTRMRELAVRHRVPMVWLLDSAGARVQEIASSEFAGTGKLFFDQVMMSGVVPQVAAVMGPCAAGTAYIPALADVVFMVKGTGSMALAGPPLVKAVTGEDTTAEDLGGSKVHCEISGCGDFEAADDRVCLEAIREYLGYFPSSCGEAPPILASEEPAGDPDELLAVVPADPRRPYDMRKLLRLVVDGGRLFELKPKFGATVITAFARLGGRPVGLVASQPSVMAGILNNDSADKAARFITLCDAFGVPLVFFQDVPGFMVGTKVEQGGIIRHGAKMLYAVSMATVPKLTVVVRKGYGAGYYVMCGTGYN